MFIYIYSQPTTSISFQILRHDFWDVFLFFSYDVRCAYGGNDYYLVVAFLLRTILLLYSCSFSKNKTTQLTNLNTLKNRLLIQLTTTYSTLHTAVPHQSTPLPGAWILHRLEEEEDEKASSRRCSECTQQHTWS
jgi:hypothetical protein